MDQEEISKVRLFRAAKYPIISRISAAHIKCQKDYQTEFHYVKSKSSMNCVEFANSYSPWFRVAIAELWFWNWAFTQTIRRPVLNPLANNIGRHIVTRLDFLARHIEPISQWSGLVTRTLWSNTGAIVTVFSSKLIGFSWSKGSKFFIFLLHSHP